MYEKVSTAQHAARHSTAHSTAPHGRARHGTARRCSAELALRCTGIMILLKQSNKKEKAGFKVQNTVFFRWQRSEELCFRHLSPLSGPERRMFCSYRGCERTKMEVAQEIDICYQFYTYFNHHFIIQLAARNRRYPKGPSGQAVVTGVFLLPPPVLAFIFIGQRVQHSHFFQIFSARRLASNFADPRSRAFGLSICKSL